MGPNIPAGRDARDAWRALSSEARRAAFVAAGQGIAPPDPGLSWAAAGYGRLMARRLRIAVLLVPLVFLVVLSGLVAVVVTASTNLTVFLFAIVLFLTAYLVVILNVTRRMRRYQRLYNSGLLGIEAVQLGMVDVAPSPAVWDARGQSEFTVPYQARIPITAPPDRLPADPVGAGVQEIPARRGALIAQLSAYAAMALVFWLFAAVVLVVGRRDQAALAAVGIVPALLLTLLLALLLVLVGPSLRYRVIARFTPAGWELPAPRISGSWAQVREIRVSSLTVRRSNAVNAQLAGYRVVALVVDDPERQLAGLSSLRRYLIRRTMKKYGSPVTIVASPRRSIPLVDLVPMLQRYTDAPVNWS
ncbi:MAG: hypothetical protein AUI14_11670 [Actinobacteria bacterium 13_2_20CM_2_71_6]|nr:MAG: hypothetical protein AUI14_11670 [Actinobacteria bacterium 13_2_20CM_2_71_6]